MCFSIVVLRHYWATSPIMVKYLTPLLLAEVFEDRHARASRAREYKNQ